MGDDIADIVEHPVSYMTDESKDTGISSGKEVSTASNEVRYYLVSRYKLGHYCHQIPDGN